MGALVDYEELLEQMDRDYKWLCEWLDREEANEQPPLFAPVGFMPHVRIPDWIRDLTRK